MKITTTTQKTGKTWKTAIKIQTIAESQIHRMTKMIQLEQCYIHSRVKTILIGQGFKEQNNPIYFNNHCYVQRRLKTNIACSNVFDFTRDNLIIVLVS